MSCPDSRVSPRGDSGTPPRIPPKARRSAATAARLGVPGARRGRRRGFRPVGGWPVAFDVGGGSGRNRVQIPLREPDVLEELPRRVGETARSLAAAAADGRPFKESSRVRCALGASRARAREVFTERGVTSGPSSGLTFSGALSQKLEGVVPGARRAPRWPVPRCRMARRLSWSACFGFSAIAIGCGS